MKQEIKRTYTIIDGFYASAVSAMIYEPLHPGSKNHIGIVLQHSDDNYFEFPPAIELASRGYTVIVSYFPDNTIPLDEKLVHLGKVVTYLKKYPGIDKVILLGHSGGATLMSAYQAVAEKGNQIFQDKDKIIALDPIDSLPAANGIMFLDANFGNGVMTLLSLDPAVKDESNGRERDPQLDMFNPDNGYDPAGSHFSEEFVDRYVKAQGNRMNQLICYARERVKALEEGTGAFKDDEPMVIPGGSQIAPYNKIFPQCPDRYFSHTARAWTLLKADGTSPVQIVPCLRTVRSGMEKTESMRECALVTTVKTFLKSSAVRTFSDFHYDASGIYGIDWDSSYCTGPANVAYISMPMLIMGMTGSYEYIAAEQIYDRAISCKNKTVAFVEGAGHNFTPAEDAESFPGEFGDTLDRCFTFVDEWLMKNYNH